jgi:stage III sporulation protein AF
VDVLTKWVLNIIIFILLATITDMLLPDSGMRKYTKLVIGLLLIAIIVTPVFRLFSADPAIWMEKLGNAGISSPSAEENALETKKKEINDIQQEYTLQQMAVQLKQDAEGEVEEAFGKSISKITVEWKDGAKSGDLTALKASNVKKIHVYLEAQNEKETVAAIKPVEIGTDKQTEKQSIREQQSIIAMLSNRWKINKEKIDLRFEGGLENENGS